MYYDGDVFSVNNGVGLDYGGRSSPYVYDGDGAFQVDYDGGVSNYGNSVYWDSCGSIRSPPNTYYGGTAYCVFFDGDVSVDYSNVNWDSCGFLFQ